MIKKEDKTDKRDELIKILLENSVSLQKVMANTAIKLDLLTGQISKLLNLFEVSARNFADKNTIPNIEKDKEFLNKLNMLIDQNKTIAKGLTLMEEKIRERVYGSEEPQEMPNFQSMAPSQMQRPQQMPGENRPGFKKLPRF